MSFETMGAVFNNYRRMFRHRYDKEFQGTDQDLYQIIENVGVMSTGQETDDAVLDDMTIFDQAT